MTVFVPRAEWGHPNPTVRGGYYVGVIRQPHLVQHHTPGQDPNTYTAARAEMQSIWRGHTGQGWGDIGYNFVVWDRYVFEARGFGYTGAHAPGANSISIGVAVLMDGRFRLPTEPEYAGLRWVAQQGQTYGYLAPQFRLWGHRDWVSTSCPGDLPYNNLAHFYAVTPTNEDDDMYDYDLRPGGPFAWTVGHVDYSPFKGAVAYDFPIAKAGDLAVVALRYPRAEVVCNIVYPSGKQSQVGTAHWGRPMKFPVEETGHVTVVVQSDAEGAIRVIGCKP